MDELTRLQRYLKLSSLHLDHRKDSVCLTCFNRRLAMESWTHKPGERAIKVGRYVRGR